MSRIITDKYNEKLNTLIDEFETSANLRSLVDFMVEEVQKDQNRKVNRNQKVFSPKDIAKLNEIKDSEELNRIFAYINLIIKAFSEQYLHIHINADLSETLIDNLT